MVKRSGRARNGGNPERLGEQPLEGVVWGAGSSLVPHGVSSFVVSAPPVTEAPAEQRAGSGAGVVVEGAPGGAVSVPAGRRGLLRWMRYGTYGLVGLAALVALAYAGSRLGAVVFEPGTGPRATPTAAATPSLVATLVPGIESVMSREQIKTTLEEILRIGRPLTNDYGEVWKKVEEANKSIYFMLTGRTFEQDKFVTRIVTREEQVPNVHQSWRKSDGTLGVAGTAAYLPDGTLEIYALGIPTMYATSTRILVLLVANETGNALDERLESPLADRSKPPHERSVRFEVKPEAANEHAAYREASKHVYMSAALYFMQELGVKALIVADTPSNREQINLGVERLIASSAYPDDGWLFAWWFALSDTEAKQELEKNGRLSSAAALKLHDKIMNALLTTDYVQTVLAVRGIKETLKSQILEVVYSRLELDGEIRDVLPGDVSYFFAP